MAVQRAALLVSFGVAQQGAAQAAPQQWYRCPSGAIWRDADCPDLLNTPPGTTLEQCEAKCASTAGCTAFNLGAGGCALRACKLHTEPTTTLEGFVGWASYPLRCPAPPPPPPPVMPLFKVGASITAKHGAACLDGSPPYYHYRAAKNSSSTRWVLFVNGGAWCFTAVDPPLGGDSCVQRARTPGGSSTGAQPHTDMGGIIGASRERNPDFFQDHHVHIAYCDGTSLSSGRTGPVPVPPNQWHNGSLYFRGRANLNAVIEDLLVTHRMADANEVIFTGGSAGGTAVILQLDHFASLMPSSVRTVGFPDAGFMLDHKNISGAWEYRERYWQPADLLWNASANTNAACIAKYGPVGESWRCLMSQYIAPLLRTPIFVMNSLHDVYQLTGGEGVLRFPCKLPPTTSRDCPPEAIQAFYDYRRDFIRVVNETVLSNPQNGAFLDSCIVHEQNIDACCAQPQPSKLNESRSGCCTNCAGWSLFSLPDERGGRLAAEAGSAFEPHMRRTAQQAFGDWFFKRPSKSNYRFIDPVAWPANPSCPYCRH